MFLSKVLAGLIPGSDFDAICDGRVLQQLGLSDLACIACAKTCPTL